VSYKLSRRVFYLDISSTEKLVLRALADRANDDGSSCYPSVLTLATETRLSRKTVQTTLGSLKEKGLVMVVGQSKGGRGKTPEYQLRFPKVDQKSNRETDRKGVVRTPFSKNKGRNCFPQRAKLLRVKGVTASPDSVLDSIHDSGGSPGSPPFVFKSGGHTRVRRPNTQPKTARFKTSQEKTHPTSPSPVTRPIDTFWEKYPTSKNYPSIPVGLLRAWGEIDGDTHLGEILVGLERWKKSDQWQTERFIKDPGRFIAEKKFLVTPPSSKATSRFDHRRLKHL
jgi:hypothetical protein